MADERRSNRSQKPAGRGGRPSGAGRSGGGKPQKSTGRGQRDVRDDKRAAGSGRGTSSARDAQRSDARGGGAPAGKKSFSKGAAAGKRSGAPTGPGSRRPVRSRDERGATPREDRTVDQRAYDGPDLPEEITGKELDRAIAAQLRGLPEKLAARVARHLVAAGTFIDDDPELAYQHAKAAKARTQRIAVIREALGEAAYAAGHYAEALAELRAAKRMNGATAYLPIMADCHRALGQPEQAIKLAHSPSVANFAPEAKAEMTIVEAGARRDMKQFDAALRILEQAPLMSKSRAPWVVRLRYAYADTLAAAGRPTDALTWFHRTYAIDADEITDATQRAEELEKELAR